MTEQSPDVRANKTRLLDDVFDRMTTTIAADRTRVGKTMDVADVRALIDRGLFTPAQAQAAGLVDGVADQGQLEMVIARALGRPDVGITDLDTAPIAPGAWPGRPRRRRAGRRHDRRRPQPGAAVRHRRRRRVGHAARGAGGVPHRFDDRRRRPARQQPGRLGVRVGRHRARDRPAARGGQAGHRLDGRHGGVGRLLHRGARRLVFAEPSTITGSIGIFAIKVDAAQLVSTAGHQRRDHEARRPRRLPVALPAVDRGGGEDGDGQDALPLRPVHRDRGERARVARPDRRAASTSSGAGRSGRARSRSRSAWSTGWAAWPTRSTRRCAAAGIPVGRDRMPEMRCCRARRWTWFAAWWPAAPTEAARAARGGAEPVAPAQLLTPGRCAPRCACWRRRCSAAAPASRRGCPTTSRCASRPARSAGVRLLLRCALRPSRGKRARQVHGAGRREGVYVRAIVDCARPPIGTMNARGRRRGETGGGGERERGT